MGGTLSEILHLPLEQRAERLLIVTLREILMQAHLEDCLNNAWQEQGKMEFMAQTLSSGFCSKEKLHMCEHITCSEAPGEGRNWMILVATRCCPCYFKTSHKTVHGAYNVVWGREGKRGNMKCQLQTESPGWECHQTDTGSECSPRSRVALERVDVWLEQSSMADLVEEDKPWPKSSVLYAISSSCPN